jgi:uncharacterized protein (DUF2164 family)
MPEVPHRIRLDDERRAGLRRELRAFHEQRFDEPLSDYHAEELLAFFLRRLGPAVYNQAIADARGYMLERLDDLDVEFHEPDEA